VPIFTTLTHNIFSSVTQKAAIPRGLIEPTKLKNVASLPPRQLSRNYYIVHLQGQTCYTMNLIQFDVLDIGTSGWGKTVPIKLLTVRTV